jgi:Ca2+-binding EF-hand superfamily protein
MEFDADEERRLKEVFNNIDTGHKGYITHDDLKSLCADFGREVPDEKLKELISKADPTNSGKVPWENFKSAMSIAIPKLIVAIIFIGAFRKLDKDNTGFISKTDLEHLVLEHKPDFDKARLAAVIAEAQPGPDGKIAFKNFVTVLAAKLKAAKLP